MLDLKTAKHILYEKHKNRLPIAVPPDCFRLFQKRSEFQSIAQKSVFLAVQHSHIHSLIVPAPRNDKGRENKGAQGMLLLSLGAY